MTARAPNRKEIKIPGPRERNIEIVLDETLSAQVRQPPWGWRTTLQLLESQHEQGARFFVFAGGRWSDLSAASELEENVLESAAGAARGGVFSGNQGLSAPMRGFGGRSHVELPSELATVKSRSVTVEDRLRQLLERLSENLPHSGGPVVRGGVEAEGNRLISIEVPNMEAAFVSSQSVVAALRAFDLVESPSWTSICNRYPGAQLFSIDADPRSIDVTAEGGFDGRASILISVPRQLRSGKDGVFSVTLPAHMYGRLASDGKITISRVDV